MKLSPSCPTLPVQRINEAVVDINDVFGKHALHQSKNHQPDDCFGHVVFFFVSRQSRALISESREEKKKKNK